jgi:hypothetical protein
VQDVRKSHPESFNEINNLINGAEKVTAKKIEPMVLTSSSGHDFDVFRHEVNLAAPYYFADGTVLKTMIRANPGIMLLKNGVVVGKWHHNDVPDLQTVQALL